MILSIFLFIVLLFFVYSNYNLFLLNKKINLELKSEQAKLKYNFDEMLELATAEQLLKELRTRKNMPFVILIPIKEKDYNGITIESHGVNQISCLAMLHLAKAITTQNFKNNGMDVPKLPPLNDYFE